MNNYQPPYQQDPYQQPFQVPQPKPSDPNGLIALILGLVAVVCPLLSLPACCDYNLWILSGFPVIGLICSIVGLVLAILVKNKGGNAIAGIILGIIGIVFNLILFFSCTLCIGCTGCMVASGEAAVNDFMNEFYRDLF